MRFRPMRKFDYYILQQTLAPLSLALVVGLIVLMIERVLRLLDLVLGAEGPLRVVLEIMAYLVPHYVGLALPISLMLGVMIAFHRLSRDGEIDALQNAGISVARMSRMTVVAGLVVMLVVALVLGFLKPYGRYAYQAMLFAVTDQAIETFVRAGVFTSFGDTTFVVEEIRADRASFGNVFLYRTNDDGGTSTISAREGSLAAVGEGGPPILRLFDGVRLTLAANPAKSSASPAQPQAPESPSEPEGATPSTPDQPPGQSGAQPATSKIADPEVGVLRFRELRTSLGEREAQLFRARGVDEREFTIVELWRRRHDPPPGVRVSDMLAELNNRIVRIVSVPFLPLLAVPLALGRKRTDRSWGIAIAMVVLILYNQLLDLGKNVAETGDIDPLVGLWLPFALFAFASVWLHWRASSRPAHDIGLPTSAMLRAAGWPLRRMLAIRSDVR